MKKEGQAITRLAFLFRDSNHFSYGLGSSPWGEGFELAEDEPSHLEEDFSLSCPRGRSSTPHRGEIQVGTPNLGRT